MLACAMCDGHQLHSWSHVVRNPEPEMGAPHAPRAVSDCSRFAALDNKVKGQALALETQGNA